MERDSFIFYKDWSDVIGDLPEEIRLEVYDAVIGYALSGKLSDLRPMAAVAFGFIKRTIDRDTAKYMSISEKRSISGKKGLKKRWQTIANDSKNSNCHDNDNDNDNDNENENENENVNVNENEKKENLKKENFFSNDAEIFQISDLKRLSGEIWLETVGMKLSVTPEKLKSFYDEFCDTQELSDYSSTINDFRRHFINWLKIKVKEKAKEEKRYGKPSGDEIKDRLVEKFKNKQTNDSK